MDATCFHCGYPIHTERRTGAWVHTPPDRDSGPARGCRAASADRSTGPYVEWDDSLSRGWMATPRGVD